MVVSGVNVECRNSLSPESIALWTHAVIPMIREVIREELKALKPLDEVWYEPSEVAAMSCGKVTAYTLRNWLCWGQIDGETDSRQVRLYQSTVEELRKNKWRPVRQPDPPKLPPSKARKNLPSQSATQPSSVESPES